MGRLDVRPVNVFAESNDDGVKGCRRRPARKLASEMRKLGAHLLLGVLVREYDNRGRDRIVLPTVSNEIPYLPPVFYTGSGQFGSVIVA